MGSRVTITKPALRVKKTDKVIPAPTKAYSHSEVEKAKHIKDGNVKRGFLTSQGDFVGREKAAKIAKKAGEVKSPGKKLHSHELRKALGIKKKVF